MVSVFDPRWRHACFFFFRLSNSPAARPATTRPHLRLSLPSLCVVNEKRCPVLWLEWGDVCGKVGWRVFLIGIFGPRRPVPVHAHPVGLVCECAVMRVPLALFRLQSTSGSGGNTTSSPAADTLGRVPDVEADSVEREARVATEEPGVASEVEAARAAEAARKAAAEAEVARMAEVARKAEVEAEVAQRVVSFAMGDHPPGWKETGLRCEPASSISAPPPTSTVPHSVGACGWAVRADTSSTLAPGCGADRPGAAARPQDTV